MKESITGKVDLSAELQPENALERRLLADPGFRQGLAWGVPRYGHPEGQIYKHIVEVLANIDRLPLDAATRRRLRLIAFVHDTFKYAEDKSRPRDWSRHHGTLARRFLEPFTQDLELLTVVELHDEAYYAWRTIFLYQQPQRGQERLQQLLRRLEGARQLFYLFFKCDTLTGDKIPTPLTWFEATVDGIEIVEF